ncbi:hypothetical protein EHV15_35715 [Paenibacillus oralis]|uniref:Secreted protein n=1 Tax=Paenibacillus oralis TaxID=2490856 RepID=A0A3P3TA49_9BACL|nr:hypothetical protein [Paenibacillus oralis]RRJ54921.1 hypothetical protein EHV15_35715 [Paenibacillus oralis]
MKRLLILALLAVVGLADSSYVFASPKANGDCYPITFFDTLEKAVTEYKELTSSSPVFMPTWLPFDAPLKSVRIVGCGAILKTEYVSDNQKIRVHVNPQIKNSKLSGNYAVSLSDKTKAEYKESKLFYALRFDKIGRSYMILIDKMNGKLIEKETAIEYLTKIANALTVVKGPGNLSNTAPMVWRYNKKTVENFKHSFYSIKSSPKLHRHYNQFVLRPRFPNQ